MNITTERIQQVKDKKVKDILRKSKQEYQEINYWKEKLEEYLQPSRAGYLEPENELDDNLKVTQPMIKEHVSLAASLKSFELNLHDGPYKIDYTRNGKFLALGGTTGHLSSFEWKTGKLLYEIDVKEPIYDINWLHNEHLVAVAQKKHPYIYDSSGVEIHSLKEHTEATCLEFLPYHMLLVSSGRSGILRYQDVSIGKLAAEWPTKFGPTHSLAQNPSNAIMHLGHSTGTVTLWSPSVNGPLVKILCGRGPVSSIAINLTGNIMATASSENFVKLWDLRTYKLVQEYRCPISPTSLDISQTGLLSVWKDSWKERQLKPYLKHIVKGSPIQHASFSPFDDVLGVTHSKGFASILVPGAGEPYFDTMEVNPFETKRQRREGEVKQLLEKLQPDMISLDSSFIGQIRKNRSININPTDKDLDHSALEAKKEYRKQRGIKKYLNKQKNIYDTKKHLIKEKLELDARKRSAAGPLDCSILDRFKRA